MCRRGHLRPGATADQGHGSRHPAPAGMHRAGQGRGPRRRLPLRRARAPDHRARCGGRPGAGAAPGRYPPRTAPAWPAPGTEARRRRPARATAAAADGPAGAARPVRQRHAVGRARGPAPGQEEAGLGRILLRTRALRRGVGAAGRGQHRGADGPAGHGAVAPLAAHRHRLQCHLPQLRAQVPADRCDGSPRVLRGQRGPR
ncbi:hypothetical protein D3C72_1561390 [compost metagenome]